MSVFTGPVHGTQGSFYIEEDSLKKTRLPLKIDATDDNIQDTDTGKWFWRENM